MGLQLIVAGMHRSGTSLTASFVDAIGISMGDRLLAADRNNEKGYFEDVDFLEFHRRALTATVPADEEGVHDWGWVRSETLDRGKLEEFRDEARLLIQSREERLSAWGWKDPRTTVILDFWHDLLPQAKYLLVYRAPWDVAESMMRVGGEYFPAHPDSSLAMWSFYNEAMLRFYREHGERCVLFSVNALISEPVRLMGLIRDKLGIDVADESAAGRFHELFSRDLFHSLPPDHPTVQLSRHYHPRSVEVLRQLEEAADLPGNLLPADAPPVDESRLAAWPFFCYQEVAEARSRIRKLEKELKQREGELHERDAKLWEQQIKLAQQEALIQEVQVKAETWWTEKQQLWTEKQQLFAEYQKTWDEKQALWEEKQKLAAQVTDLYRLYEELTTQRTELLTQLESVHRDLGEAKWQQTQLTHERDRLQGEVEAMKNTRVWKLGERLRRLKGA